VAPQLRECRPDDHRIDYTLAAWSEHFPWDEDLIEIHKRCGEDIARGNLFDLGREAKDDPSRVRRFVMAVMMWGYGTVGYGAYRTSQMLGHSQAIERLARGAEIVRAGDLVDACLFFRSSSRGALPQFSWSFITKYFYFVGVASGTTPMPLILDGESRNNGVAGGMRQLAAAGDAGAARAMQLWWASTDRLCAQGYALYVDLVNVWARDLGCRPDAIEMALWQGLA
jgi:hypothetical protein